MLAVQAVFPMHTFTFLKTTWQKDVEPFLTAAERRRVQQMGGASSSASATHLPQVVVSDGATDGCKGAAGHADAVNQQQTNATDRRAQCPSDLCRSPSLHAATPHAMTHAELCTSSMWGCVGVGALHAS